MAEKHDPAITSSHQQEHWTPDSGTLMAIVRGHSVGLKPCIAAGFMRQSQPAASVVEGSASMPNSSDACRTTDDSRQRSNLEHLTCPPKACYAKTSRISQSWLPADAKSTDFSNGTQEIVVPHEQCNSSCPKRKRCMLRPLKLPCEHHSGHHNLTSGSGSSARLLVLRLASVPLLPCLIKVLARLICVGRFCSMFGRNLPAKLHIV